MFLYFICHSTFLCTMEMSGVSAKRDGCNGTIPRALEPAWSFSVSTQASLGVLNRGTALSSRPIVVVAAGATVVDDDGGGGGTSCDRHDAEEEKHNRGPSVARRARKDIIDCILRNQT